MFPKSVCLPLLVSGDSIRYLPKPLYSASKKYLHCESQNLFYSYFVQDLIFSNLQYFPVNLWHSRIYWNKKVRKWGHIIKKIMFVQNVVVCIRCKHKCIHNFKEETNLFIASCRKKTTYTIKVYTEKKIKGRSNL